MPTPTVYALGIEQPYAVSLPSELKTVDANVLYATDRLPRPREDGRLDYGVGRDPALAVGEAVVNIGGDATWEELASDASTGVRSRTLNLGIVSVTEKAWTPNYPLPYTLVDGQPVPGAQTARKLEEVALQRTATEAITWAARRWTFYTSPSDQAIGIAEFLFSGGRIGRARYDDISDVVRERTDYMATAFGNREAVIEYEGEHGGQYGHNYFRTNPAVASDLVLTVRYGRPPGAEHGRPLEHQGATFWKIGDDYLQTLEGN